MSSTDSDEQLNEWLFSECQETGRRISALLGFDERAVAIGVTLLIGAATIAISKGSEELLLGLPVAYGALLCFIGLLHGESFALAGYKAALEEHLASRVGHPVVVWESKIAPRLRRKDPSILIAFGVMFSLYFAAAAAAIIEATRLDAQPGWRENHAKLIVLLTAVAVGVIGLAAIASLWSAGRAFDKSRNVAAEALREGSSLKPADSEPLGH